MKRTPIVLIVLAVAATTMPGCAAREPDWPLRTTKIQTGAGTVEQVRRRLEGTWTLQTFEVLENGVPRDVTAHGALTYDRFGNLALEGVILHPADAASRGEALLLNYSGRVVIDPGRGELRLEDVRDELPGDEHAREVLALSPVRRFRFEGDTLVLVLAARDGSGVARARFVRAVATR